MWVRKEPVGSWIRIELGGAVFWVMPPTNPDFGTAVLSDPDSAAQYLELLKKVPEVASLSLLMSQLSGNGMEESRWRVNMSKLERLGVVGVEGLRDTG